MSVVIVSRVEKFYGNQRNIIQALNDISFTVEKQKFIAVMGVSGSGKTTLLNVTSTIDAVSARGIEINGNNIYELWENGLAEFHKRELGLIFQDFNLLDTLTLQENIALSLILSKKEVEQINPQVNALAETLQIQDILEKYPYWISGGQRQRYACARAMIHDLNLILANESTDALDSRSPYLLMEQFQRMNTKLQATILMVTHDALLVSYTKRALFLKDGTISNETYRGSLTRRVFLRRILDAMQLLGGDVHAIR